MSQPAAQSPVEGTNITVNLDRLTAHHNRIQNDLALRLTMAEDERDAAVRDAETLSQALTAAQTRLAELEGTETADTPPRQEKATPPARGQGGRGGGNRQ